MTEHAQKCYGFRSQRSLHSKGLNPDILPRPHLFPLCHLLLPVFLQHSNRPLLLPPLSPFSGSCSFLHFCVSADFPSALIDAHGFSYQFNSEESWSFNLSPELWTQPFNSLKTPPCGQSPDTPKPESPPPRDSLLSNL